jgi:sugar lactone lactonase YvrE
VLGVGPVWSQQEQALYWVDIRGRKVRRHRPATGETKSWDVPEPPGSLALRAGGGIMVALRSGAYFLEPGTGKLTQAFLPDGHGPAMRFNDGKCDPGGRFWVGSMNDQMRAPDGVLYRIEPSGKFVPVLRGVDIPNSLCWSPDGRTMYFADSAQFTLWAFPFEVGSGEVGERRVVLRTAPPGVPDGAAVDSEGCIWFAMHDAWQIVRCTPQGEIVQVLSTPAQLPTAVAFGGPELGTLYVTTKFYQLTEEQLRIQPLAGALLALDVGVRGLPEPCFKG